MSNTQASIITIGDELLIGQTIDTNSARIAQMLNAIGIDVIRRVAVGDDKQAITGALDEELSKVEIVLITGGLGPTADDITKPLLCDYFGGKLVIDERVLAHVKEIFLKNNRPFIERNMKQAEVPDVCTVLFNKMGTAPGMWFEKDGKVIISMPGVPFEMASIMELEVVPRLKERFIKKEAIVHSTLITAGEGESFVAERIKDIEESLPAHIKLAYLPGLGMVKLRLTAKGTDAKALENEVADYKARLYDRLANIVIAEADEPMEEIIGKLLLEKKLSLGLAESCTGGNIAHHITNVPGSSVYFKGNVVSYQDEIKQKVLGVKKETIDKHGVVSEQTAIEMATGARQLLNVDIALSITGVLGPEGDGSETSIGTVWMAICNKETVTAKKFFFRYDRPRNKEMATQMAMLMIYRFINNKL